LAGALKVVMICVLQDSLDLWWKKNPHDVSSHLGMRKIR
jgi:hypothetical protein